MASRPKLTEVAELAGVSIGTASQALNNKIGVAPETRQRVLEAAQKLGYLQYSPSRFNPNISTVGVLMKHPKDDPDIVNPFYSYVLAGAERECQRHNLSLMYASIEVDEFSRALSWPPMLSEQQVDGLLIVGAFLEPTISQISEQAGLPIVLVDGYAYNNDCDRVVTDNVNGAFAAVNYLIDQGHRHIGLIGSDANAYPSIRERRKGYTRALKTHEISKQYIEDSILERESAYAATVRLLERAPQITAIFACNDDTAIACMKAAREMGRRLPDDLSVIGFDDIDLAQEIVPTLTTIHVDKLLMGAMGVRHLVDRVRDPERASLTTSLGTQLIIRESVIGI
ncbi:MAG: LacI family DNA-binding transcriptional regulator [Chloroflexi bacterium]|nr:LacI family DNA-binding transcriptional regulator [Chloroflexota bacterium]